MHEIKNILIAVSIWVIIIPVITGSWLIKRMSRDSLIVFLLVILATPPQLITSFVALRTKTLNVFYNVYTPCEFIFLFWLFYNKYKSKTNNLVFRTTGFLYLIVSVVIILKFSITKLKRKESNINQQSNRNTH